MPDPPFNKSDWILETTDAAFDADVVERSKQQPVVVDFWAEWCQPCRLLTPILEKLADEYHGKFVLVKAHTEQTRAAAARLGVQSIPAVYGFREGELLDAFVGVLPEGQLRVWLDRLVPTEAELRVAEARKLEASDATAAEAAFREAVALDANLATAKIGLAGLLLRAGRNDESRELIEQLQRRGHLEPEAEKIKAELDVQALGQQAGDVDACRAAVAENREDLALRFRLAEALAAGGQYEEALQIALQLIREDKQQFGESAKQLMVDIFQLLPDDSELTSTYRRQLATALY
jgi:putative thioredoxin